MAQWNCDHLGSLTDLVWSSHNSIYWQDRNRILLPNGTAITWGAWLTYCDLVTTPFIDRNEIEYYCRMKLRSLRSLTNLLWSSHNSIYWQERNRILLLKGTAITWGAWLTYFDLVTTPSVDRNEIECYGPMELRSLGELDWPSVI
jgi:hypothetical protein